ncbi:MAG: DNA polymerase, partial [Thermodesulfobacteriota bacterium]
MMNEFLLVLLEHEKNGIYFDVNAVNRLKEKYKEEQKDTQRVLENIVNEVMGDTPVNLSSPEQLSQLIYSRKVKDKVAWARTFNLGQEQRGPVKKEKYRPRMSTKEFQHHVRDKTNLLYKTTVNQCKTCKGKGRYEKTKKDGAPYKKLRRCIDCQGEGYFYKNTKVIGGLKQIPSGVYDTASGGFKTDKTTLEKLTKKCSKDSVAHTFMINLSRNNQITTWKDTFIAGVLNNIGKDNILHPSFSQVVTTTGRRAGSNPNMHNFPRGDSKFLLRGCIKSRWPKGKLIKGDFKTLEFRTAVHMANDKQGIEDVLKDVDAHSFTSKALTEAGQPTSRQDAKPHTFKPLYGGTSGTKAERNYYKCFLDKYSDIAEWHQQLQDTAIENKVIVLPTGREYAFPNAKRTKWGSSTYKTQIVNWPGQGFATADIVPVAGIEVLRLMKEAKVKSLFMLEVHDELLSDLYPGEDKIMIEIYKEGMGNVEALLKDR